MNRFLGLLTALVVTSALPAVGAGQALASHVRCGDVITQDTTLDSDLIDCPGDGIVIGASRITVDLNGHTIDGVGTGAGVNNAASSFDLGHDGVTIKDGVVREFGSAVFVYRARDSVVRDLTADADSAGIVLLESQRTRVLENSVTRTSTCGICVLDSFFGSGNRIERNFVSDSAQEGIHLVDTANDQLLRNSVSGALVGINVSSATNTRIESNRLFRNRQDGVVVDDGSAGTLVKRNAASENADDGIDIESADTTVTRNVANFNADLGIEAIAGTVDGRGNSATGNGNPLQCVNVTCR